VTFREGQTAEVRTLHVWDHEALKRLAKMKDGQKLSLKYRSAAGAAEPEIIGISQPGDGWKRGVKIVLVVAALYGVVLGIAITHQ